MDVGELPEFGAAEKLLIFCAKQTRGGIWMGDESGAKVLRGVCASRTRGLRSYRQAPVGFQPHGTL